MTDHLEERDAMLHRHPVDRARRVLRPAALAILAGVAVAGLAACSAAAPHVADSPSADAGASTSITMPSLSVSAWQGSLQYAIAKGYLAKYGVSATTPLSSEGPLKAAVVSGDVQVDQIAGGDTLDLYAKHVGIQAVACTGTFAGFDVYARKGTKSLADLVGKSVGVPSLGGAPQVAMQAYLDDKGVSPDSVKFVALGSIPNVLTALTSGKIDAGLLSTPFNFKAADAGLPNLGYAEGPPIPWIVNTAWAKKNPQTVTNILKGLIEGTWAYQTDEADAIPVLARFLGMNTDDAGAAETLKRSFANYLPPIQAPPGRCRASDFRPFVKYQDASEQEALKNLAPLFDNSYIDRLEQGGFYTRIAKKYGPIPKITLAQIVR